MPQTNFDPTSKAKKLPKNVYLKHTRGQDTLGGYKTLNRYYHNEEVALGGSKMDVQKYMQDKNRTKNQVGVMK